MKVLSICTGMGLLDRAFMDAGFEVVPGCEIDPQKRAMYAKLCGGEPLVHDLADLPRALMGRWSFESFGGIIGGPSCQSHSKLKAIRKPKFPDLTPLVEDLLLAINPEWFMFENVVPIDLSDAWQCHAVLPAASEPRPLVYPLAKHHAAEAEVQRQRR
jgi:site-specific DNA-cytosine methylase